MFGQLMELKCKNFLQSISFWSEYAVILNFLPSISNNYANVTLLAILCGPTKILIKFLFQSVIDGINSLHSKGIQVQTDEGPKTIHAKVLNGIYNTVARAPVRGTKQFNGTYGCPVCLHPGKNLSNNSCIYFPSEEYI